jgi:hypothetical protein
MYVPEGPFFYDMQLSNVIMGSGAERLIVLHHHTYANKKAGLCGFQKYRLLVSLAALSLYPVAVSLCHLPSQPVLLTAHAQLLRLSVIVADVVSNLERS